MGPSDLQGLGSFGVVELNDSTPPAMLPADSMRIIALED